MGIVPAVAADTHTVSTTAELEAAFASAASGDTIVIAAGTYYPLDTLDIGDRSLTIVGVGSGDTIIDGSHVVDQGKDFLLGRDDDSDVLVDLVAISGLTVRCYGEEGIEVGNATVIALNDCVATDTDDGFYIRLDEFTNARLTMFYCSSYGNDGEGFSISIDDTTSLYFEMSYCHAYGNEEEGYDINIQDTTGLLCGFFYCSASNNENEGFEIDIETTDASVNIIECSASFSGEEGFSLEFEGSSCTVDIDGCIAHANGEAGMEVNSWDDNSDDGIYIYACTFSGNDDEGIAVYADYQSSIYVSNVISFGNEYGIYADNDGTGNMAVSNCTVYGNDYGLGVYNDGDAEDPIGPTVLLLTNIASSGNACSFFLEEDPYIATEGDFPVVSYCLFDDAQLEASGYDILPLFGDGILFESPLFAQPLTADFRPMAVSPLIDAGFDTSPTFYGRVLDDIRGIARPQKNAYDIGAYEFNDVEPGLNPSGPATFKPLVSTVLEQALILWEDVLSQLPEEMTAEQEALVSAIQGRVEGAMMLGNPIAAAGALRQAMAEMQALLASL
ncbi:MAG: right-handed parallel beta-helix repeat-containing protein [Candidatus Methanofastidiosa archaeon]|nr:right-handed parallel beta-helix repeat-containing protein [Candidatus Methanofastidiosa archaeon]